MKLSFVTPDNDLATAGIWKNFGEPIDGKQTRLRIGFSGPEYRAKLAKLTRNASQQLAGRDLPIETLTKLNRRAMVGTLLKDWEELENEDGTPIESKDANGKLNEANAEMLLNITLIFDFVNAISGRLEDFKKEGDAASDAAIKSEPALESAVEKG